MLGQDCLLKIGDVFYLIGVTWVADDYTTPQLQFLKSEDDGATWSHILYGPNVFNFPSNTTHAGIACLVEGTSIRVFYCSDTGTSSQTGLTGLLSTVEFDTLTEAIVGGAGSDFNAFNYTFDNVSAYALSDPSVSPQIGVRRTSGGIYRIIFQSEFN